MTAPDAHEVEDGFIAQSGRAMAEGADRMVLAVALIVMAMIQVLIVSEVLSDADAEEITTLFELGFVTIGAFDIVTNLILLWLFKPYLSLALDVAVEVIKGRRA